MLIGVMGTLLALTPLLFKLLIRGDYGEAYNQLPVLYGAMIFSCLSSVLGGIYIAYKKTANVGISTTIAALINLTIDILFVKAIGIWAGSISTLVSYIVLLAYRGINIQKFQEVRFNVRRFIIGLMLVIISSVLFLLNTTWANIVNVILACFIVIIFDRKVLSMLFKMIKHRLSKHQ
jgi:O-antigen/teichoic acid export membrane protein